MMRPEQREPETPASLRLLPMELQIGDRLTEETGEFEVVSRPHPSAGGKLVSAHVRKVGRPEVAELRTWGAHERISVKRTTSAEKGQR